MGNRGTEGRGRRSVAADLEDLSRQAAQLVLEHAREAVAQRGRFSLVLAGGGTPRALYRTLAAKPFAAALPWEHTLVLWGDERAVPPEDPESNYGLAQHTLLDKVPLPADNILRMPADQPPLESAARRYESRLRELFPGCGFPRFDLLLLGVGPDGHMASLFPGSPLLAEQTRWVLPASAPAGYPTRERLTLSLPLLNAARCVTVLAAGESKRPVLERLFGLEETAVRAELPASYLRPEAGELIWLLDRAAAPR